MRSFRQDSYSGLPPEHLLGEGSLRNVGGEKGIRVLKELGIEYVIFVDSPSGELERIFPGIENGNASGLELVYDPNGWEQNYGAKKVYVYRVNQDGYFKSTNSYISSSPLIADVDGDGDGEIIAASDMLYIWKKDGSSLSGFPAKTEGLIASTPNIAYTKNGAILFVGSDDNKLYAWWYNGSSLSGFPRTTNNDVFSRPLLVDMDLDSEVEVVTGSDDGRIYAWHINGTLLNGFPFATGGAVWATVRISDIDGDGSMDILVASDLLYAWNRSGVLLKGFPIRTQSYMVSSPVIEDLDFDSKPEIVVAGDSLYVYNSSGGIRDGWPIYTGYYFWASPSVFDIDRDGLLEIIIGDWSGSLYAFKPNGSTVAGFPKHTCGKIFASAAVGDIDRDGMIEVVVGSWDKNIYRWKVKDVGSYRGNYVKPPEQQDEGAPFLNNVSYSMEYGVIFLAANLSGHVERPGLHYYGDDKRWHPSPMMRSEGKYTAMIAPQRQKTVKYYITMEDENMSYRFPIEGYYELQN